MSYDIFFQPFERGQPLGIDRSALLKALAAYTPRTEPELDLVHVQTSDGGKADVYGALGEHPLTRFSFNPAGNREAVNAT
jgi:hypothetical protein